MGGFPSVADTDTGVGDRSVLGKCDESSWLTRGFKIRRVVRWTPGSFEGQLCGSWGPIG